MIIDPETQITPWSRITSLNDWIIGCSADAKSLITQWLVIRQNWMPNHQITEWCVIRSFWDAKSLITEWLVIRHKKRNRLPNHQITEWLVIRHSARQLKTQGITQLESPSPTKCQIIQITSDSDQITLLKMPNHSPWSAKSLSLECQITLIRQTELLPNHTKSLPLGLPNHCDSVTFCQITPSEMPNHSLKEWFGEVFCQITP